MKIVLHHYQSNFSPSAMCPALVRSACPRVAQFFMSLRERVAKMTASFLMRVCHQNFIWGLTLEHLTGRARFELLI